MIRLPTNARSRVLRRRVPPTIEADETLDWAKYKTDQANNDRDFLLKKDEFALKERQYGDGLRLGAIARSQLFSPLSAAVLAGMIGLYSTYLGKNRDLDIEVRKDETSLILKASEAPDEKKRAGNVIFFYDNGYLPTLTVSQVTRLRSEAELQPGQAAPVPDTSNPNQPQANMVVGGKKVDASFYQDGFAIDVDGSPHAYNPQNTGLDDLANVKSADGAFVVVVTAGGKPVIQGKTDPAPGFYVTPTALADPSKAETDPRKYVDSETIPYIVVPFQPRSLATAKVAIGNVAVVYNTKNGKYAFAVVAEFGPRDHLGEGSIALANSLGINSSARTGGMSSGITYKIFQGSKITWPLTKQQIDENGQPLFEAMGGLPVLKAAFPGS